MTEKQKLIHYLLETNGFRELDTPVIVTSGEFLTPFFCNTENLLMDENINTFLSEHGDDPKAVINHAVDMGRKHKEVDDVISCLTQKTDRLLAGAKLPAISGGQRRDWLFSGPVASRLNLPHISIFKPDIGNTGNGQKILMDTPSGERIQNPDLSGHHVLHIADLLTRGSSIYSTSSGLNNPSGWLPAVRKGGAQCKNLLVVVSRSQGGEEMLARQGLQTHSCMQIDADFINHYGKNRESILLFLNDPVKWTVNYLKNNGIDLLLSYAEKDPKKLPRLAKFMSHYKVFLEEMGWMQILQKRSANEAA